MIILKNTGGIVATNAFLIADESSGDAVLFDAPNDTAAPLLDEVHRRGWTLRGLWLTHGHWDHLADHAVVRARFPGAKILLHKLDEPFLTTPGSRVFSLPFTITPGKVDQFIDEGDSLTLGSMKVDVIHTPGHSPGHVVFHFPREKLAVSGDLIIMGTIGRTDLPGCDPDAMMESVRRLMQWPDDTVLLTGHGDDTTIGLERANNRMVQQAIRND